MNVGEKIKTRRIAQRVSQREMAARLRITPEHPGRLESGKSLPSAEVMKRITEVFEVSADYLLGNEEGTGRVTTALSAPMLQRVEQLATLDDADQQALMHIIDCMVTKRRIQHLVSGQSAGVVSAAK
jgi:transcriptional regulator with XRE-family HTH domain